MTKETKIGLLVGLGVIIFIGILISDHLSVAQQQQPANLTQLDTAQPRNIANTPQNTWPIDQRQVPLPPTVDEVAMNTVAGRTEVIDGNIGSLSRRGDAFQPDSLRIDTGRDGVSPPIDTSRVLGDSTAVTPPSRDKVHYVATGDSLYKIAQKYYGDGSYYKSIYEANKDKMRSPADLRVGVRLVIPDRGGNAAISEVTPPVIEETTRVADRDLPPSMRDVTPPVSDTTNTPPTSGATKSYTIQKGDVLGTLAQKFYGTSKAWPKLLELNKGVIKDPDHLVVGTTIKVPK